MVQKGFLKKENQDMLLESNEIGELITKMEAYKAPEVGKWIMKDNL